MISDGNIKVSVLDAVSFVNYSGIVCVAQPLKVKYF